MRAYDYDVIVVGGGPAGCHTAISIAKYSNQNLSILLIDRNPKEEFGKKTKNGWSCGDAVSKRSIDFIKENLGISYSYPELEHAVQGVIAYSPDRRKKVLFEGEGYVLNRKLWPQKQFQYLKKFGIEVKLSCTARKLLTLDNFVCGIECHDSDGNLIKLTSKVIVDASGSSSVLRVNLPIKSYIEKRIDKDDLESTGRYIVEFEPGEEDNTYFDPNYCIIHLDQYLAPGGYCLTPDSLLLVRGHGVKEIKDINIEEEVLTRMGWMPVSSVYRRYYRGKIIVVTPYLLGTSIRLTPDHLVLTWNKHEGYRWKRADTLKKGSKQNSYEDGDYLVFPLPKDGSCIDMLDINKELSGTGYVFTSFKDLIPNRIKLDSNFMRLLGMYIMKGNIMDDSVIISDIDESKLKEICKIFERVFLKNPDTFMVKKQDGEISYRIKFTSILVSHLFKKWFGEDIKDRHLPDWIFNVSKELKLAILESILLEGNFMNGKRRKRYNNIISSSKELAYDVWLLLLHIGLVGSIKKVEGGYEVTWSINTPSKCNRYITDNDNLLIRIKGLQKSWYDGYVYDLQSAGEFCAPVIVHNCWTFPKGGNKANIGLGIQKKSLERRNAMFNRKDELRDLIEEYIRRNKAIKNPKPSRDPIDAGNVYNIWQVPVRRQNDCLVANGYAIVGDAAWMPRPIDAGGIGPALYASVILGRVVAKSIEANDFSERSLWEYNVEYMRGYGSHMASFEILRRVLQNLTNDEINYGMKNFLSYDDVERITRREHPRFTKTKLLNPITLFNVIFNWKLVKGLRFAVKKHERLVKLYAEYPETPEGFKDWHKYLMKELNEAYRLFP